MIIDINRLDCLAQKTFAARLEQVLGWENVYAYNAETFGPHSTLGRTFECDTVMMRTLLLSRLIRREMAV